MKVLYFTLIALVSLFLYKRGEAMISLPPFWRALITAHETATRQCNGVTQSTPGVIKLAADQTCRQAFVQLDMAAMNACPGWGEAKCRLIPGQYQYECTVKMSLCWTDLRTRTLLDCTYKTLADTLRDPRSYAGGASGSGYASTSGSGAAGASGSGYAGASGSGYAGASGSGSARASGSSRGSPPPFRIPSLPPTPQSPSIPEDPSLLYDPDFTPDAFSYQAPTHHRGPTPRNPLPSQYPPAPAFSTFSGRSFESLPPTPQPYTPVDPNLPRDETFGVDDVPYGTPLIDADPAGQGELADKRGKGKRKLSSGVSIRSKRGSYKGKNYECQEPDCNKSFDKYLQFRRHKRHHDTYKPKGKETKTYKCPYNQCVRSYESIWRLEQHIKAHEGQATCPYCNKTFSGPENMKIHASTKHPDKPAPP